MGAKGAVCAIVTPFTSALDVDDAALDDYLAFLEGRGVQSIVTNGTTGEFASLTREERMRLVECCRRGFAGTIINHISSCSYRDCHALLDHSREYADAVLLLPPFYFANVSPQGSQEFLKTVLARSMLPAYLYNFPEHTQVPITPALLGELARELSCLAGVKDSGGDIRISRRFKQAAPNLEVYVGNDRAALEVRTLGLDGSVTGGGNPVPEFLVRLHQCFEAGSMAEAERAQKQLDVWTTFREGLSIDLVALVKAALGARIPGFPSHVRPPFVAAVPAHVEHIRETLLKRVLSGSP